MESNPIGLTGGINTYGYVGANPLTYSDPTGEFANAIVGAIAGVATGYAIAVISGDQCYGVQDALRDAALGAVGAGLLSKANKLYRIVRPRSIARSRGLTKKAGQKGYMETLKGGSNALERLNIKHQAAKSPGIGSGSKVPRYDYRVDAGRYWDPFSGKTGPSGALSHVPLELFIPAGVTGGAVGSASSCGYD